jgi:hypothetical protein
MKKIVLIIAFILIYLQGKAQQEYDTIIYYPPAVLNCPMWMDSANLYNPNDPSHYYQIFYHYGLLRTQCGYNIASLYGINVIGECADPMLNNIAFSQPYHLDSAALVIGIAAKVYGRKSTMGGYNYFRLRDSSNVEVAYCSIPPLGSLGGQPGGLSQVPLGKYYFNNQVMLKDFYLSADVIETLPGDRCTYQFDHTCTFNADTTCLKIDKGCPVDDFPYLMKGGSNQWTRFDQDTVYWYYRKMHIGFYPIILVPKLSLDKEMNIDNTCNVLPNPAKNYIKVMSHFKINDIEIFDIRGIMVKSVLINSHEKQINISDLALGTYLVKINTARGSSTKKLIKE